MSNHPENATDGQADDSAERFHRLVKEAMLNAASPAGITFAQAQMMLNSFADHVGVLLSHGSNEVLSDFLKEVLARRHFYRTIAKNTDKKLPTDWRARRASVFKRDKYSCVYCGKSGTADTLHCDHFTSRSQAGSDDESNLVTACSSCNTSKGAKAIEDWLQ